MFHLRQCLLLTVYDLHLWREVDALTNKDLMLGDGD